MLLSSKAAVLVMVTILTLPFTSSGVSSLKSLIAETIPGYSQPCTPAVMTAAGPGLLPVTVATGKKSSLPHGVSKRMISVFFSPILGPLFQQMISI